MRPLIPFIITFVFLLCEWSAWAYRGDQLQALIISADNSFLRSESDLKYAHRDAQRLSNALVESGEVPPENIRVLKNPTRKEFSKTLRSFAKRSKKFLFYFSGHSTEKGLHFRDGRLSRVQFHGLLNDITADTKIIILDSCFSGGLKNKGVKKSSAIKLVDYGLDEPTGSVILTSSSAQEFSYESESLKGSIFTYHLVSGLYGQADSNGDGLITIDELYQYVYLKTKFQSLV